MLITSNPLYLQRSDASSPLLDIIGEVLIASTTFAAKFCTTRLVIVAVSLIALLVFRNLIKEIYLIYKNVNCLE